MSVQLWILLLMWAVENFSSVYLVNSGQYALDGEVNVGSVCGFNSFDFWRHNDMQNQNQGMSGLTIGRSEGSQKKQGRGQETYSSIQWLGLGCSRLRFQVQSRWYTGQWLDLWNPHCPHCSRDGGGRLSRWGWGRCCRGRWSSWLRVGNSLGRSCWWVECRHCREKEGCHCHCWQIWWAARGHCPSVCWG